MAVGKPQLKARKANRGSFVKGDKRAGRPKGLLNKATTEVREWARAIFNDPIVQASTLQKAQDGTLAPAIYNELLHYAYGKPKDTVELTGHVGITRIIDEIVDPGDDEDS